MTVRGKWRIVEMPDYAVDHPDMMEPAYSVFDGKGGVQFALGVSPAPFTALPTGMRSISPGTATMR